MAKKWYDDEDDIYDRQDTKYSDKEQRRAARKTKEEKIWKSHEEKLD